MSAQEFKVGQTVSGEDFAYLPRGTVVAGPGVPTRRKDALGMWVTRDSGYPAAVPDKGMAMSRTITYLPDATEPEDKDDLYVEPEPLKEDDAVLLWARIVDAKPDSDGEVEVSLWRADGYQTSYATTYTLPDAIVRPAAGQVPPWVKPAEEPTGLGAVVEATRPGDVIPSRFIRHYALVTHPGRRWVSVGGTRYSWADLTDPKVLSEGWSPDGAS